MMLARTLEFHTVRTEDELKAVGAFRYQCYLSEGLIDARCDEVFLDTFDYAENAHIVSITSCGRIVGTIRLHILDRHNHRSATMTSFSDILMPKIEAGLRLIDGARFAVAPDLGAMRLGVARHTLRQYENYAAENDVDYGVAAVLDGRVDFYRRLWGFDQISEPRTYSNLNKKLVLLGVDLRNGK
jgi:N-acyl-L-homoserine lactone synthetase